MVRKIYYKVTIGEVNYK